MINTRKTYLKLQVGGVLGSECSPVLVDILLHVGILWCEKPILTRSATLASCRSKYMWLQLSLLTNGEIVNYSHLGIFSETNHTARINEDIHTSAIISSSKAAWGPPGEDEDAHHAQKNFPVEGLSHGISTSMVSHCTSKWLFPCSCAIKRNEINQNSTI